MANSSVNTGEVLPPDEDEYLGMISALRRAGRGGMSSLTTQLLGEMMKMNANMARQEALLMQLCDTTTAVLGRLQRLESSSQTNASSGRSGTRRDVIAAEDARVTQFADTGLPKKMSSNRGYKARNQLIFCALKCICETCAHIFGIRTVSTVAMKESVSKSITTLLTARICGHGIPEIGEDGMQRLSVALPEPTTHRPMSKNLLTEVVGLSGTAASIIGSIFQSDIEVLKRVYPSSIWAVCDLLQWPPVTSDGDPRWKSDPPTGAIHDTAQYAQLCVMKADKAKAAVEKYLIVPDRDST